MGRETDQPLPYTGQNLTPLGVNPEGRDFGGGHDAAALARTYATRLRKGLAPSNFGQIFGPST